MTVDLLKVIGDLKGAWMIGSSGLEKSPPTWKSAVQDDAYPELALVALTSQAVQFALQPSPGGQLQTTPALPRLRLPTPPPSARRQFGMLVRVAKLHEAHMIGIIQLLAARGYAVHPIDYMPKSFGKLPDLYAPWEAWQKSGQTESSGDVTVAIDSDNWNNWFPADRRMALSNLRQRDPAAARKLIGERAASLAADERLRILELMSEGLSVDDQQVLESFMEDRSSKVRAVIQKLLARIGVAQDTEADVTEFANFFTVSKKLLSRAIKITANPLKTDAQKKRREELAAQLSLQSFVKGLQLDSEAELVNGWEHVDGEASDILVQMIAATGSEQTVALLASRIASMRGISAEAFKQVFDRMGKQSRLELLPRVLENGDPSFSAALTCCQGMLGEIPWEMLESLPALKTLIKLSKENSAYKAPTQDKLREGLFALGLMADQSTAGKLLQVFINENLLASDPMLGVLKLNQCLPPGEAL